MTSWNPNFGPMSALPRIRAAFNRTLTDRCDILHETKVPTEFGSRSTWSTLLTCGARFYQATPFQEQQFASEFQGRGGYMVNLPLYQPDPNDPTLESSTLLDLKLTYKLQITSTATGEVLVLDLVGEGVLGGSFPFGQLARAVKGKL